MERIEISDKQEQTLLSLYKKRNSVGIALIIIGLIGIIPTVISFISDAGANYYYNSTFFFSILGILFTSQNREAVKSIKKGEHQAYKTECKKVRGEYASVENNEILSKKIKKPIKRIAILGSAKSMKTGDDIGILYAGKEFWAFPFND